MDTSAAIEITVTTAAGYTFEDTLQALAEGEHSVGSDATQAAGALLQWAGQDCPWFVAGPTPAPPQATTDLKLRDRGRGHIVITLRDGVVVGAMGSEPERFMGLTLEQARHLARYGGRR